MDKTKIVEITAALAGIADQLQKAPKRACADPWSDWPGGYTSGHTHPVVYALWAGPSEAVPLYIGHTEDLGSRLGAHLRSPGWSRPLTHASFVESPALQDAAYRTLVERFLLMLFQPTDNDPSR